MYTFSVMYREDVREDCPLFVPIIFVGIFQETVAALIGGAGDDDIIEKQQMEENLDGVPIFDNHPIDFSGGAALDGEPMVCPYSSL